MGLGRGYYPYPYLTSSPISHRHPHSRSHPHSHPHKYIDSSTANSYAHRCYRNQSSDQTSITSFICSPRSRCSSSKNVLKK